ncbi:MULTISPECIES: hypothetical protein [unclassified Falsihalocynthiibacter]
MSAREAARYFNKDRKTIAKMLRIDKAQIKKQRNTAKRIFERLRDEPAAF